MVTQSQASTHTETELFYLSKVNQLRVNRGLNELWLDDRLNLSAAQKTAAMINQSYWGHYAKNGTSFSDFIW